MTEIESQNASFLELPVELIIQVLSYLDVSDIQNIYDTCHFLQDIINDEELWKNMFLKKFKTTKFSSITKSYKYSIELIKRQQLVGKWRKATGIHKNLVINVPNVEKFIFQYPKVVSFSDQGGINITSIDKGKSEVTIPLTTPSGCTSYHFNPSGSVFGRFDGRVFTKLLNGKSSYVSGVSQLNGTHEGIVSSIYNDDVNCFSGDSMGEVFKWDLKSLELISRFKVSTEAILKLKGSNNTIIAVDDHKIHVIEGNDSVKVIEVNDVRPVEFFDVDFAGKLIIIGSFDLIRVYSFDPSSFGRFYQLKLKSGDEILNMSLEEKGSIDIKIAGKDGCNLGILTDTGTVMTINIRNIISKNGLDIQPQVSITPIFDTLNVPEGVPPVWSIGVNSTVILLGSYNGFAAIYDVLTGEYIRMVSVRIPKKYLLYNENSLIPVKSVQLGSNNETHGILLINNIIQYFQFGSITDSTKYSKRKVKKSITGAVSDRKNIIQKKIKFDINELNHLENERFKNEMLINKYNGDELTDHEQLELAMVLNDSLQEHHRHKKEIRAGKQVMEEDDDGDIEDELAQALELSRIDQESLTNTVHEELEDGDNEYEKQLQEALRRSLYE